MPVVWLFLLQLSAAPVDTNGCTEEELHALRSGLTMMARGDQVVFEQAADEAVGGPADRCGLIRLARSASLGWVEARRVALEGGHPDLLAPVRSSLNELEQLKEDAPATTLEVEYAQTAIRGAVAAAQDERPEMELLLTHARDLAERLMARGRRATWPRPFNLLAGELWFEVDRFEEARAAYERAVRGEESAIGLVGLARAQAKLKRLDEACRTYRRTRDASAALRQAAASDLAHCR